MNVKREERGGKKRGSQIERGDKKSCSLSFLRCYCYYGYLDSPRKQAAFVAGRFFRSKEGEGGGCKESNCGYYAAKREGGRLMIIMIATREAHEDNYVSHGEEGGGKGNGPRAPAH